MNYLGFTVAKITVSGRRTIIVFGKISFELTDKFTLPYIYAVRPFQSIVVDRKNPEDLTGKIVQLLFYMMGSDVQEDSACDKDYNLKLIVVEVNICV